MTAARSCTAVLAAKLVRDAGGTWRRPPGGPSRNVGFCFVVRWEEGTSCAICACQFSWGFD